MHAEQHGIENNVMRTPSGSFSKIVIGLHKYSILEIESNRRHYDPNVDASLGAPARDALCTTRY